MKLLNNILCRYEYHHKSNIALVIKRYYSFRESAYRILFDVECTNCNSLLYRQSIAEPENLRGKTILLKEAK